MGAVWVSYGCCMGDVWVPYGCSLGAVWVLASTKNNGESVSGTHTASILGALLKIQPEKNIFSLKY